MFVRIYPKISGRAFGSSKELQNRRAFRGISGSSGGPIRRSRANVALPERPIRRSRANLAPPGRPKRRSRANLALPWRPTRRSRPSKRSIQLNWSKTSANATKLQCLKTSSSMDIDGSTLVFTKVINSNIVFEKCDAEVDFEVQFAPAPQKNCKKENSLVGFALLGAVEGVT